MSDLNTNNLDDWLAQGSSIIPSQLAAAQTALIAGSDLTSITDVDQLLRQLDAQESLLEQWALAVHNKAQQLRDYKAALVRARYIDGLPMELIAKFFTIASHSDYRTAIAISHVCRQWRTTALGTPNMWSSLDMGTHTKLSLFELFVDRSKSHPLDIKMKIYDSVPLGIHLDDADPTHDEATDREAFVQTWTTALVAHIGLWRTFHFALPFEDELGRVALQLSVLEAPLLESFELTVIHETVDSLEMITPSWSLLHAPGLRSLSLSKYCLDMSSIGSKLVNLTVDCDNCFLEYLTHCVALRSAQLSIVLPLSTEREPVTHDGLHDLGITFYCGSPWQNVTHVFNSLLAPSLFSLKLCFFFSQHVPPPSFMHLIKSPTLFPQLTRLSIAITPGKDYPHYSPQLYRRHCSHLPSLLRRVPTVTYLELVDVLHVKELFSALGSSVLPRMHTIHLNRCSEVSSAVMGMALEHMLKSRQHEPGLAPVHTLEVRYCQVLSRVPYEDVVKELVPDVLWLSS